MLPFLADVINGIVFQVPIIFPSTHS